MRCGHTVSAGRWWRCIDHFLCYSKDIIVVDMVAVQSLYKSITVKPHLQKEQWKDKRLNLVYKYPIQ